MYFNVFLIYELSSARQQRDVWNQVELLPCTTAKLAVLHGSRTTWFQTSRYCRAKVEFNRISLVRHGSSTMFETGLRHLVKYGALRKRLLQLFKFTKAE